MRGQVGDAAGFALDAYGVITAVSWDMGIKLPWWSNGEPKGCEDEMEAQCYAGKAFRKAEWRDFDGRRNLPGAAVCWIASCCWSLVQLLEGCPFPWQMLQACVKCQMSFETSKGEN